MHLPIISCTKDGQISQCIIYPLDLLRVKKKLLIFSRNLPLLQCLLDARLQGVLRIYIKLKSLRNSVNKLFFVRHKKIAYELLKSPKLKPEYFSIRVLEQLPLIDAEEIKNTTKKKV